MRALGTALVACLLLAGCEEPDLPKSWRLSYARVLAVRAEVIGDEARATPEPGERVRVRVLIVGDQPIDQLSHGLIACPASPPLGELPSCAGAPFFADDGELAGAAGVSRELIFELDIPQQASLGDAERVLFGGTICTDGTAEPAENGEGRCAGSDAPPVNFAAHIELVRGDAEVNHNPILADDAIRFDGAVWAPYAVLGATDEDAGVAEPVTSDAGAGTSAEADGEEHELEISLEHSARETSEAGPEELLLSHFVTGGELGRRFSVLERDQDGAEPFLVKWHMPRLDSPPASVLAVFVLRDQRGGVAYALREVEIE